MQTIVFLAIITMFTVAFTQGQTPGFNLKPCQISVPTTLRVGHADFTLSALFYLDDGGKPARIKQIGSFKLSQDEIQACIGSWGFPGLLTKSAIVARFRWSHGNGWTELILVGKGIEVKITLAPESDLTTKEDRNWNRQRSRCHVCDSAIFERYN